MTTFKNSRILALLGLFAVAACTEVATDPALEELTPGQQLELAVLADQGSFDIAVDLTTVANEVATARGLSGANEARALNAQARAAFAEARRAMLEGDNRRALDVSRVARRLIARALIATGGVPAVEDLIERLQAILLTMDDEVFDDVDALRAELEVIIAEAQALLDGGDSVGAAARAVLGEQHARLRRGRRDRRGDIAPARARLEVALARSAVSLARRLIASDFLGTDTAHSDVRERHDRWLAHAERMLERARMALDHGRFARAVHFAQNAQWSALKAVILPGGVSNEELRGMVKVARILQDQAAAAIGDPPTELQRRLFERAGKLIEIGIAKLEEGQKRGVAPLWRASIMLRWLMG